MVSDGWSTIEVRECIVRTVDIYWLAGIVEGEGCFHSSKKTPTISIGLTDLDIIYKIRRILNDNRRISQYKNRPGSLGTKTLYRLRYSGHKAVSIMFTLYSLLGSRRKLKIKEVINIWRTSRKVKAWSIK